MHDNCEILRESGLKSMRNNITAAGSGDNATSAGGGAHRVSPTPIKPSSQLEPSTHAHAEPGGSTAGDRVTERLMTSGPRNCSTGMSSSQQSIDEQVHTTFQHDDVQIQPMVQVSAQPTPVQAQPSVYSNPVVHDNYVGHNVRAVWARQAPQRLVVGDPSDPRFNRGRGQ